MTAQTIPTQPQEDAPLSLPPLLRHIATLLGNEPPAQLTATVAGPEGRTCTFTINSRKPDEGSGLYRSGTTLLRVTFREEDPHLVSWLSQVFTHAISFGYHIAIDLSWKSKNPKEHRYIAIPVRKLGNLSPEERSKIG